MSSARLSALLVAALSVVLVDWSPVPEARAPTPPPPRSPVATMAKLPVRFEANVGQTHEDVRFIARKGGSTLFLADRGATLAIPQEEAQQARRPRPHQDDRA